MSKVGLEYPGTGSLALTGAVGARDSVFDAATEPKPSLSRGLAYAIPPAVIFWIALVTALRAWVL